MTNKALIVIGILVVGFTFFVNYIMFTPQEISVLKSADFLCNFQIGGYNIGQFGQAIAEYVAPELVRTCEKAKTFMPFIQYEFYLYVLGLIILVIGLAVGEKREKIIIKEVEKHIPFTHEKGSETEKNEIKILKKEDSAEIKFCRKCGNKIKKSVKFCNKCGNKI
ncbi:MAG: zinc ribbon domain-containing protein [Candidatus Aenigmarchaeota archaeon]|nr:zinc ribbon domain-containing protein [Candidatus Aenigmarchaeota archaeon]